MRILAAQDIFDFDAFVEAEDEEKLVMGEEGEESSAMDEYTAEDESSAAGEAEPAETGGQAQFEPLNSDELTRMETPK